MHKVMYSRLSAIGSALLMAALLAACSGGGAAVSPVVDEEPSPSLIGTWQDTSTECDIHYDEDIILVGNAIAIVTFTERLWVYAIRCELGGFVEWWGALKGTWVLSPSGDSIIRTDEFGSVIHTPLTWSEDGDTFTAAGFRYIDRTEQVSHTRIVHTVDQSPYGEWDAFWSYTRDGMEVDNVQILHLDANGDFDFAVTRWVDDRRVGEEYGDATAEIGGQFYLRLTGYTFEHDGVVDPREFERTLTFVSLVEDEMFFAIDNHWERYTRSPDPPDPPDPAP